MLADGIYEEEPGGIPVDGWWEGLWREGDRFLAERRATVLVGGSRCFVEGRLFSVYNDNSFYKFYARVARRSRQSCVLILSGKVAGLSDTHTASSAGWSSSEGDELRFNVGRAIADRITSVFDLPRRDRRRLDEHIAGRFWPVRSTCRIGEPIGVVLEILNHGSEPVWFQAGGLYFGRDEHFSFQVHRDGCLLPQIEMHCVGGGMAWLVEVPKGTLTELNLNRVARGTTISKLDVDLRSWAQFDVPGRYEIDCRYQGTLYPEDDWSDEEHLWDFVLTGKVCVNVVEE